VSASIPRLQLDLATAVSRLEQLLRAGGWEADPGLAARVLLTDLPRLRSHLTPEALELVRHWRGERSVG
jgi:hypothetical protein